MYMWQKSSVFSPESAQRNVAGHLIDKNVFKTTRSFRYQWFRVSTQCIFKMAAASSAFRVWKYEWFISIFLMSGNTKKNIKNIFIYLYLYLSIFLYIYIYIHIYISMLVWKLNHVSKWSLIALHAENVFSIHAFKPIHSVTLGAYNRIALSKKIRTFIIKHFIVL